MNELTGGERFNKFMSMGGKGSGRRVEDIKAIRDNWDLIKGFGKSKLQKRGKEDVAKIIDKL